MFEATNSIIEHTSEYRRRPASQHMLNFQLMSMRTHCNEKHTQNQGMRRSPCRPYGVRRTSLQTCHAPDNFLPVVDWPSMEMTPRTLPADRAVLAHAHHRSSEAGTPVVTKLECTKQDYAARHEEGGLPIWAWAKQQAAPSARSRNWPSTALPPKRGRKPDAEKPHTSYTPPDSCKLTPAQPEQLLSLHARAPLRAGPLSPVLPEPAPLQTSYAGWSAPPKHQAARPFAALVAGVDDPTTRHPIAHLPQLPPAVPISEA